MSPSNGCADLRRQPRDGPRPPVRLTRRGRVVLAGLGAVLALLVAGLAAPASQASPASSGAGGGPVVVVQPGDTLWSVAARHRPHHDLPGRIEEIRRLNDLPGHTIHPGQELVLPAE